MEEPKFFSPIEEIRKHGARLPHWQQTGATYFITFRLADSLPQDQLHRWREEREHWLSKNPVPWDAKTEMAYHRMFSRKIDDWLDRGSGACVLGKADVSQIVEEAILHFDAERYWMHSCVVMPNHIHVLVTLHAESVLEGVVKSWKGFSAKKINEALGRTGKLWKKHYFDRLIRDQDHFFRVARYIRSNPEKARLPEGRFRLYESRAVRGMLG